jgi:DNA-directed RNA polymerase subunit RPC12/RpoP
MPSMLYKCFKCNKDINSSDVRYIGSSEKTNIICSSCLERYKMSKKGITPQADDYSEKPIIRHERIVEKIQYQCQGCSYIFYVKKDSPQKHICPYCGKDKLFIKQQFN